MPRLLSQEPRSCAYDDTLVNSSGTILFNPTGLGKGAAVVIKFAASGLVGPEATPTVGLSTTATDPIYGVVDHIDLASQRVNVWIDGTVQVTKSADSVAGDVQNGIIPDTTTGGQVTTVANLGRGSVFGRVGDNSPTLYVDLSVDAVSNA